MKKSEVSALLRKALAAAGGRAHEPVFSVSEDSYGWWFSDRGRPIAFIHRESNCFDPFEFSPFRTRGGDLSVDRFYDMGSRLGMHLALLPNVAGNFVSPGEDRLKYSFPRSKGRRLVFTVDFEMPRGIGGRTTLSLDYSRATGAYRYRLAKSVSMPDPGQPLEFCNFYAAHLGDGIPAGKKWSQTVWLGFDGRLHRLPHNPAITFSLRKRHGLRKDIAPRGFIGFGTEEDFNPLVLFRGTTVPLFSKTCDMWHDEHLSGETPGNERNRDGRLTVETGIEPVNLPAPAMAALAAAAEMIPLGEREIEAGAVPGVAWESVSDMGRAIDPRRPWTGMVFVPGDPRWLSRRGPSGTGTPFPADAPGPLPSAWADGAGPEGGRCLSLAGGGPDTNCWGPAGFAFHVAPRKRYRFSALARTTGSCEALLSINNAWQKWHDFTVRETSAPVKGGQWRRLEAVMENDHYPYLYFHLCARGRGEAFFDQLFIGPA